jgi:hypothetical protein
MRSSVKIFFGLRCIDGAEEDSLKGGDEEAGGVVSMRLSGDESGRSYTSDSSEGPTNGYDRFA